MDTAFEPASPLLGLRTSPFVCPVFSLPSPKAKVILRANDKHLSFRSVVGVEIIAEREARVSLGTRVHCRNWFGRFYMAVIDRVHRGYISPTILRRAVDYALVLAAANDK